jgi:hypothetical protein
MKARETLRTGLEDHFQKPERIREHDAIATQHSQYFVQNATRLAVEPRYAVPGEVRVRVSHPWEGVGANSGGVTEILEEYEARIDALAAPGSFAYLENQYFTRTEIARRLFEAWQSASRAGGNEGGPFAYIVVPYRPETHWIDDKILQGNLPGEGLDTTLKEMYQCIKWLEIKTARRIYLLGQPAGGTGGASGVWVEAYRVQNPREQIRFSYSPSELPESRSDDFGAVGFELVEALEVASGRVVKNVRLRIGDCLTDSDIMAFTLASTQTDLTAGGSFHSGMAGAVAGVPVSADGRDTAHEYCRKYGIYIHSKCSLFREAGNGGPPMYWATIGSANLNDRSLIGRAGSRGQPDSEMNIFWSDGGTTTNTIIEFWDGLWREFGVTQWDPAQFHRVAMENLLNIQRTGRAQALVTRLDVVTQYRKLSRD